MDKVTEINGDKEKGREQTYELEGQDNRHVSPAPEEEKFFKLSFDDRHLPEDMSYEKAQPEKDFSKEEKEIEQDKDMDDLEYEY